MKKTKLLLVTAFSFWVIGCSEDSGEIVDEPQEEIEQIEDETEEETDPLMEVVKLIDIIENDSLTCLVNKQNPVSENYEPEDLVPVSVPTVFDNPEANQLRKEAADALEAMFLAAEEEGFYLYARSGY